MVAVKGHAEQLVADPLAVSLRAAQLLFRLLQVQARVLWVTNSYLHLRQVLHRHSESEANEVLVSGVRCLGFALVEHVNQFRDVAQHAHSGENGVLVPDLLRQIENLSVKVGQLARVIELFDHIFNEQIPKAVDHKRVLVSE